MDIWLQQSCSTQGYHKPSIYKTKQNTQYLQSTTTQSAIKNTCVFIYVVVTQLLSYVQLWDSMDCSPRTLCPWNFPGKNTGVGCHFLLQGIFLTQGSNQRLLHWQVDSLPLSHLGSPFINNLINFNKIFQIEKSSQPMVLEELERNKPPPSSHKASLKCIINHV